LVTLKTLAVLMLGNGGGKTARANPVESKTIKQQTRNFVLLIL